MKPLMLDLNFLPRDNGPPSSNPDYEELRRQKFAKFEMQCSKVRTACSPGKCSRHSSDIIVHGNKQSLHQQHRPIKFCGYAADAAAEQPATCAGAAQPQLCWFTCSRGKFAVWFSTY
jgi:hypothetical protein